MVDVNLALAIGAGVLLAAIGVTAGVMSLSKEKEPPSEPDPYSGDEEYYNRGGRSKKRSRKHKKKTMRRNK